MAKKTELAVAGVSESPVPKTNKKGWRVICPHCGQINTLVILVHTLTLECTSCRRPSTQSDLLAMAAQIDKLLNFLGTEEALRD